MKRAFSLVENERIGAADDDGDGLLWYEFRRDAGYFDYSSTRRLAFFDEICCTKFVFRKSFYVGYGFAASRLAEGQLSKKTKKVGMSLSQTLEMNSISSRSTSFTAIMFSFCR